MTAERWGYYYEGSGVRGVYPSMVAAIEAAVADAFDAGGDLRRLRVGRMITPRASEYLDRMDDDERDVGGRRNADAERLRLRISEMYGHEVDEGCAYQRARPDAAARDAVYDLQRVSSLDDLKAWGDRWIAFDPEEYCDGGRPLAHAVEDLAAAAHEADRLRRLFDDAGEGQYNVLNLIESYQRSSIEADERIRAVRALLEWNGCDCECDHAWQDHGDDCDRCLACRIGDAVGR